MVSISDQGPRYSYDRGATWREAQSLSRLIDGPPVEEFYNLTVSEPDMFGRVWVGGHVQDVGGVYMVGRDGGFEDNEGEFGFSVVAPRPINLSNPLRSKFRTYSNSYGQTDPGIQVTACDLIVPGPNYDVPDTSQQGYTGPSQSCSNVSFSPSLPVTTTSIPSAIAVSPQGYAELLVGTRAGQVYRGRPGADGKILDRVIGVVKPVSPVTALYYATSNMAYVGYDDGVIYRLTWSSADPAQVTIISVTLPDPAHRRIMDFADQYGSTQELYVATTQDVFRSLDGGAGFVRVTEGAGTTGKFLVNDLASGVQIVGLARDKNYPFLYVATGRRDSLSQVNWHAYDGGFPAVYRSPTPAQGVWTAIAEGLPARFPIVDIEVSPNRALFLATQGRGIWWRRDVAAVPPNSGVNTPESGLSGVGERTAVTTICSDPQAWRNIHTFDFKLAEGLGPGDGAPFAAWLQFDEDANLLRLYDPESDQWLEGAPGSSGVLRTRNIELDLAATTVAATDATKNTVAIHWALTFLEPTRGQNFQQFLQVQDDQGNTTGWDQVGDWRVSQTNQVYLPAVGR